VLGIIVMNGEIELIHVSRTHLFIYNAVTLSSYK